MEVKTKVAVGRCKEFGGQVGGGEGGLGYRADSFKAIEVVHQHAGNQVGDRDAQIVHIHNDADAHLTYYISR